jgi:transcriptional regulator with XRE-family HTH domain
MENSLANLGFIIKQKRKEQKMSQAQLAQTIGVDQATISRIEKGNKQITLDVYKKALHVFQIVFNETGADVYHVAFNQMYEAYDENDIKSFESIYQSLSKHDFVYHNEVHLVYLVRCFYDFVYHLDCFESDLKKMMLYKALFKGVMMLRYEQFIGLYHMQKKQFHLAYEHLDEAYHEGLRTGETDPLLLYQLGWIHFFKGNHTTSTLILDEARIRYLENGNEYRLYSVYNIFGMLNMSEGNYDEALEIFLNCLHSDAYVKGHPSNYYNSYRNMGLTYFYREEYAKALEYLSMLYYDVKMRSNTVVFFILLTLKEMKQMDLYHQYLQECLDDPSNSFLRNKILAIFLNNLDDNLYHNSLVKELEEMIEAYNLYSLTYFMIKHKSDELFHQRQYSTYKNMFDHYIKLKVLG